VKTSAHRHWLENTGEFK